MVVALRNAIDKKQDDSKYVYDLTNFKTYRQMKAGIFPYDSSNEYLVGSYYCKGSEADGGVSIESSFAWCDCSHLMALSQCACLKTGAKESHLFQNMLITRKLRGKIKQNIIIKQN